MLSLLLIVAAYATLCFVLGRGLARIAQRYLRLDENYTSPSLTVGERPEWGSGKVPLRLTRPEARPRREGADGNRVLKIGPYRQS